MAGVEQLCYDLGWRGPQPGRNSRGNPANLVSQLKDFFKAPGNVGRTPEELANKWLLANSRKFDHAEDCDGLFPWKKDGAKITNQITKIFRILTSGESMQPRTSYQNKFAPTPSRDSDDSPETNGWPDRRQGIAQSSTHGPIKMLLNRDPHLEQELLRNGLSGVKVHPTKDDLITEFPTNYPGRRTYRRDNQLKPFSDPIYFATTDQEVHAEKFEVTKNYGGCALTDVADVETTGPCIYVVPSAGNGGNQRDYHGWLGGDEFTKDPIARTLGETVMRARAPETSPGKDTEASHLRQPQARKAHDKAAPNSQIQPDLFQTETAMRSARHMPQRPSATAASVMGETGSRTPYVSNSDESRPQKRKRPTSPLQLPGDFNRFTNEYRSNQNTQHTEANDSDLPTFPLRMTSPPRGPIIDNAELQRSGLLPLAGGEPASNAKTALSTLTNKLTLAVTTAERLDAKLVKNTEALADAIEHIKALLPLASHYLAISEAGIYPKHQENLEIVRKAINVREGLKIIYNETNDERKSLQGRSTVSKHIFTHTEDGAQAPASIMEWASTAKTAPDLVGWAQYANAGLDMGNSRRKTRH